MIKIVPAKEIYLKGNNQAVLLLHAFTSHTRDMKKVAIEIHKKGFTCYAPLYRGHGCAPEQLLQYNVNDWWQDVVNAYQFLISEGFQKISVIGLSIGGIFTLKLAEIEKIERAIVLSVPIDREPERLKKRIINYAYNYKKVEGKSTFQISQEIDIFNQMPLDTLIVFQQFIKSTSQNIDKISVPIAIFYGEQDDELYAHSANVIYNNVNSNVKKIKGYKESKHLMTLGKEQEHLVKDILEFFNC